MVSYELDPNAKITEAETEQLAAARKMPVVFDDDSPEMSEKMEKAFIAARKEKPFNSEAVTVYVSAETVEKAKTFGDDYLSILGKLLDKAVSEYKFISQ